MKVPAVVFTAPGRIEVRDIVLPPPAPGRVRVRSEWSTISAGTEGWACRDRFTWQPTRFPCVPGYQRVGVVAALGDGVDGWRVGERVVATTGAWDGPVAPFWGAHVAEADTWAGELWRLPDGADPLAASALVVAQVGWNAASRIRDLAPGEWVVVWGDGLIGQCAAQAARARGARVALVGHRAERLAVARAASADAAIDGRAGDAAAEIRALAGGPVRAVLDTVQGVEAQAQWLPLLEPGVGQVVYCGFSPATAWADMAELQKRELTTHSVAGWNRARMDATLALIARGALRPRPLLTHVLPAARGDDAYRMILDKTEPFVGIALDWARS